MCTLQNTRMLSSMDQQLYTAIADFCHFPNRILFVYQGREPGLICTRETKRPRSDLSAASTSAHLQWVQTIWTTKPISIKQHPDDVWMKHWHHRLYWQGLLTKHVGGFFRQKSNSVQLNQPCNLIPSWRLWLLQVVDHLFLGDEMCGFVDEGHEGVEFVGPVVQQIIGIFGPLEVDDACQPVHFGVDGLVHYQVGQELLRLLKNEQVWTGKHRMSSSLVFMGLVGEDRVRHGKIYFPSSFNL